MSSKSPLEVEDTPRPSVQTPLVAVVGNPNAGKTTLFNALTGAHQKVGNYPGVTVEKVSGFLRLQGVTAECTDVPGMYSLSPVSEDERVAVEVIEGKAPGSRRPDLLVCVVDASNLERNLYLFSQLSEEGFPILVALTMVDRLERRGLRLDVERLEELLGTQVVPIIGHKEKGLRELRAAISEHLEHPRTPIVAATLEPIVSSLKDSLAKIGMDFSLAEVRSLISNPTEPFRQPLDQFPEVRETLVQARNLWEQLRVNRSPVEDRYRWATDVQNQVLSQAEDAPSTKPLTDKLDYVLTHRVFGLAFFVGLMYLVFQSIYTFAQPLMGWIEGGFSWLQGVISPTLEPWPIFQSLVIDGLIGGVGSMLVFLPQILILFFFVAMLEGTGYLARAAFLMDRLLGWCGLNGRAFIPLLSSFACAIPGIMAARVMPDAKSRLATILVAPLMSCSARLPVYLLLIGAFIQPKFGAAWAGFALFAMHFLGLIVAIPLVWFFNRKMIRGKRLPFLLELPPYQWPKWKDVWLAMYFRGKVFVQTAGTIIVVMSVLIWALSYFPRLSQPERTSVASAYALQNPGVSEEAIQRHVDEEQLANSILGRFGKTIEPIFLPAGFDWRITTSILSAFPARETVVPSLGIIFSLGGDVDEESGDLRDALREARWPDGKPLFTAWTAAGLMIFFALCAQCMATLATVKRETNSWKWAAFMFTYMTALAYLAAVAVHQIGQSIG